MIQAEQLIERAMKKSSSSSINEADPGDLFDKAYDSLSNAYSALTQASKAKWDTTETEFGAAAKAAATQVKKAIDILDKVAE